jgi:hypothetical protein
MEFIFSVGKDKLYADIVCLTAILSRRSVFDEGGSFSRGECF